MRPRFLHVVLAVLVGIGSPLPTCAQAGDPEMERGIRQAQEGQFEQAIVTLRGVLPRLLERKAAPRDVARVHVYLGVSHLGLDDPAGAAIQCVESRVAFIGLALVELHDQAVLPGDQGGGVAVRILQSAEALCPYQSPHKYLE